ncbi:MAG: hypothetical protein KDA60_20740 [Planctomycetales bacterium]|nr:hypothetical protein [Planctomycetales bacterium]
MRVLFLGKGRHQDHPTIGPFLAMGPARGHVVQLCDKRQFVDGDLPLRELSQFDLVCLKSHYQDPQVAKTLERIQVRSVNRLDATVACLDRGQLERRLRAAHIPLPASALDIQEAAALTFPLVQKPLAADLHKVKMHTEPPSFDCNRYFYQQYITAPVNYKVYCVGERMFVAELGCDPESCGVVSSRRWLDQWEASLGRHALQVGQTIGLEIFNVDLVPHEGEYLTIDVNPFPGFVGAEDAPSAWWEYLESL